MLVDPMPGLKCSLGNPRSHCRRDAQGLQPMERGLTKGLVSVVIVTWNSAQFLGRCLAALAEQTHPDIELIHIDNNSDDDSVVTRPGLRRHGRQS